MITTPEQMREAAAQKLTEILDGWEIIRKYHQPGSYAGEAAVATIRAIPIAPQPATDWTTCAADMLRVWDTWFGGSADGDRAASDRLAIASAFAAQAFEHAAASGITADGAPTALLRAFLLALIDKLHPDLDYLRADPSSGEKARADRGAVAPPVVAAPKPTPIVDGSGPGPHYVADMLSQFVASVWHLLDNSEMSGPIDNPITTVMQSDFDEVSKWLDRLESLPSGSTSHLSAAELVAAAKEHDAEIVRLEAQIIENKNYLRLVGKPERSSANDFCNTAIGHHRGSAVRLRDLITLAQHDALAAHVAAEVAKARAEDAAMIAQLEQDLADANSGADDAYRRGYWAGGNGA